MVTGHENSRDKNIWRYLRGKFVGCMGSTPAVLTIVPIEPLHIYN